MFHLTELLDPHPSPLWHQTAQCGIEGVVTLLDGGEQQQRWLQADGTNRGDGGLSTVVPWSREGMTAVVERFAGHGLSVVAFEDTPPMDALRMGLPGASEQLEQIHEQIRAMGALGIPTLCYNWMTVTSWARTVTDMPIRAGALTTGYRREYADALGPVTGVPEVSHAALWHALDSFLDATLPVAEEAGVVLALHPDDPPLSEVRGVPRIITSLDVYRRILATHPSPSNKITFCQGNFGLMTDDLPAAIAEFLPHIAFVHFRDVEGTADDFSETFHDDGPTDLAECMRLYIEGGFEGPMRPDHVPTMYGETNDRPGYGTMGRLFALGYIRGLQHGVHNRMEG